MKLRSRYPGLVAALAAGLVAACSSTTEPETPTPLPTATPESVLSMCGEQGARIDAESVTAFRPQHDGYIWTLPDGSDASVTTDDIRASDPNSDDSTAISFPAWSQPAVSPDHLRSAITFTRRLSGFSDTKTLILVSSAESPVLGTLELEGSNLQALVTLQWLADSGCLAALIFEPTHEQQLFLLSRDGEPVAEFSPKLGRGTVYEAIDTGWIVVERLTWEPPEIELFSVNNAGTTVVVGADDVLPGFPGLPAGITARQYVDQLKNRVP